MRKSVLTLLSVSVLAFILTSGSMDDNGRAGVTGAPLEGTCRQSNCHITYQLNSGTGSISAASTMNSWTYVPGQTYTINITVRKTGVPLFGIGAGILQASGDNAGTLLITQPTRTQIKTRTIGQYIRRNVVHQLNGGRFNDSCVFSFNWQAPSSNIGNVTLYAAGNCANSNDSATGDFIYTLTQVIQPDLTSDIVPLMSTVSSISVFPNPATDHLNVSFTQKETEEVRFSLTDLKGAVVAELLSETIPAGPFERKIDLPALPSGVYLLHASSENGHRTRRVIVR